jgi:hypothetical protein
LFESKEVFEIMIDHVTPEDAGVYKCVAVNSEGKDETSGRITVNSELLWISIISQISIFFQKLTFLYMRII